jgi:hypothetical protein
MLLAASLALSGWYVLALHLHRSVETVMSWVQGGSNKARRWGHGICLLSRLKCPLALEPAAAGLLGILLAGSEPSMHCAWLLPHGVCISFAFVGFLLS